MELTKEQIKQGLAEVSKNTGQNMSFSDGFNAGVKYAQEQFKKSTLSIQDAKQEVAELYDKENWQEVLHDYEYGLGISKLIDFEDLMDKVARFHAGFDE